MKRFLSTKVLWIVSILLVALILSACSGNSSSSDTTSSNATSSGTEVSFSKDVLPIFTANCTGCHASGNATEGIALDTYANVTAGRAIVTGNADSSRIVREIQSGRMPPGGKLSSADIQTIVDWINQGAKDN